MNQQLSKLLEKLATKLGTTTEYLWGVLLRQARISATITLFYLILFTTIGIILFKLHRKFIKTDARDHNLYYHQEELGVIMAVAAILWGICFAWSVCSLPNIFNGYTNPEYWALKEILNAL